MTKKTEPSLKVTGLYKYFKQPHSKINILNDADLAVYSNEIVAVIGPSGCGKTTFLQILGLLDRPARGEVVINGVNYSKASDYKKTICRRLNIGFIYQAYNLLANFTALENVMLPLSLQNVSAKKAKQKAMGLLDKMGLYDRADHFPSQLSGGEQQRVAIARSIIHEPAIILADEPTGNLDKENSIKIIDMLIEVVRVFKTSLVIVTHNPEISNKADRIVTIDNGKIISQKHHDI